MSAVHLIAILLGAVALWIISGFVVKVMGFIARLAIRLLIVAALLGFGIYLYHRATGKPVSTSVEWKT